LKLKQYRKNYALNHPEKIKEWTKNQAPKQVERQRKRRIRNKLELIRWKGGKCEDCGYSKNLAALDFHNHTGDINPSDLLAWSLINAKKRLKDSKLLCSNCHRERHHPELNINPSRRDNIAPEMRNKCLTSS
jgi:predicted HNH restriction endonuclease